MNYTVIWKSEAEQRLADIWLQASDKEAVRSAADQMDHLLKTEPERRGESRPGGRRILIELPLGVFFRVNTDDCRVHVLAVWRIKKRT